MLDHGYLFYTLGENPIVQHWQVYPIFLVPILLFLMHGI